ncbi:hypothetical protein AXF42_Ash011525 [Apostasia shenzhenica]|uniref:Uncharacterized protein n=1 Tax=Apostasia shenzhenica TaxID=1088818 RepID=A0A2I0BAU8_9ASPA|nr:hypothetical protein AXF42_Ash011525 [Apostasia shenzhenica]
MPGVCWFACNAGYESPPVLVEFGRLLATDILALASMKNAANHNMWCELQNPVNHRVFKRKLRSKPIGRGHASLVIMRNVAPAVACVHSTQNWQHELGCGVWPSAYASSGLKSALSLVSPSPDEGGGSIGTNCFVAFSCDRVHQMITELTPSHGHCYPGDDTAFVVATSGQVGTPVKFMPKATQHQPEGQNLKPERQKLKPKAEYLNLKSKALHALLKA